MDHTFRGTRMRYNNTYQVGTCVMSLFLFVPGVAIFFIPHLYSDKSLKSALFYVTAGIGMLVVACLAPLEAFREFVVVTDDGLIRSNLFGQISRMEWKDISSVSSKNDGNEITFWTASETRLKTSVCYNGWADLLEMSALHLNPVLQFQLEAAVRKATPNARQLENAIS